MNEDYDADDESKTDENLMPPPPAPIIKQYKDTEMVVKTEEAEKKKLETPLAAMLPSKYANIDVTELFPDFRHGKVRIFKHNVCSKTNCFEKSSLFIDLYWFY